MKNKEQFQKEEEEGEVEKEDGSKKRNVAKFWVQI